MKSKITHQDISVLRRLFLPGYTEVIIHDLNNGLADNVQRDAFEQDDTCEKRSLVISGMDESSYDFSEYDRVIHFARPRSVKGMHAKHFRYLPVNGFIRWMYPKGNLKTIFDFYHASTLRAKLVKTGLRFLSFIGLDALVTKNVTIYSKEAVQLEVDPGNVPCDDYSIFFGTPGPERTAVVSLLNGGKSTNFLKVGLNTLTQNSIGNEGNTLFRLSYQDFRAFEIPKSRSTTSRGVIAVSKLKPKKAKSTHVFSEQHAAALRELFDFSGANNRFDETQFGDALIDNCEYVLQNSDPNGSSKHLLELIRENLEDVPYDCYYTSCLAHGDFTPWNMFVGEDKLYLYDWESSKRTAPFLFDLFHFHFQTGTFIKELSFDQVYQQIESSIAASSAIQEVIDQHNVDVKRHLQLYVLYAVSRRLALELYFDTEVASAQQLKVWKAALEFTLPQVWEYRRRFIESFNTQLSTLRHAFLKFEKGTLNMLSTGSDLDIAIHPNDLKRAIRFCKESFFVERYKVVNKSFMSTIQLYFKDSGYLSIDLIHDFRRKWVRFMNITHLLRSAHRGNGGIVVPDLRFDLEYALMFYSLNGAEVPRKYQDMFANGDSYARRRAVSYLNHKYNLGVEILEDAFAQPKEVGKALRKKVSKTQRGFIYSRLKMVTNYLSDTLKEFKWRKGFIITISGVDGVGKSSVIEKLKKQIQTKYRKEVVLLRHRPRVLPILSALKYGSVQKAENASTKSNPGESSTKSSISSAVRFSYYYLDYILGQFYIYMKYVLRGKIVLYDRYYFDFIGNPERTNLSVNKRVAKWLYRGVYKPALNVLLYASPEEILRRKQELDKDTIERLTKGYMGLFNELSRKYDRSLYVIHRNDNLEDTIGDILKNVQKVA